MTWRDMVAVILGLIFLSSFVCGMLGRREITKLVKWLHTNKRHIWLELGSPGTFFFRGDPGNSFWSRTTAYSLIRSYQWNDLRRKLSDEEAVSYLEKYQKYRRISGLLALSLFLLLFVLASLEESELFFEG